MPELALENAVIPGSRSPLLFLVELGAGIKVASTAVPLLNITPLELSRSLTVCRICTTSLCFSSTCRNRRIVL